MTIGILADTVDTVRGLGIVNGAPRQIKEDDGVGHDQGSASAEHVQRGAQGIEVGFGLELLQQLRQLTGRVRVDGDRLIAMPLAVIGRYRQWLVVGAEDDGLLLTRLNQLQPGFTAGQVGSQRNDESGQ